MVRLDTVLNSWKTPDFREKLKQYSNARRLTAEPRPALAARCLELKERPEAFFMEEITRMDGHRMTRMEMLQFTKEHEVTHRAQPFVYLRLMGIVPAIKPPAYGKGTCLTVTLLYLLKGICAWRKDHAELSQLRCCD
jgi:uncharacterized damage-inducible protein DinB